MGLSPPGGAGGTGGVPETPGVMPVLAGIEDPGVLGAVGSCCPTELVTAVVMSAAAAGTLGSGMLGMPGRPADLASWCCSVGWLACAPWPAGVPDGVLAGLALGEDEVLDGLVLPAMSPARVGFTGCAGALGTLGVTGVLGDSGFD